MNHIEVDAKPGEVGLDAERLSRIDRHFARYVDRGELPGWLIAVTRRGRIAHVSTYGDRDVENRLPVTPDTLFRIYSMTKPITSVAAMMLYEEGAFELSDPVSAFIPSFADQRIFTAGSALSPVTEPVREPMRIWHLLTHTSGLTYANRHGYPVDALYRHAGLDNGTPYGGSLAEFCDRLGEVPLLFQPGTKWNYSVSSDVVGRVVEVAPGLSLAEFFSTRILGPLGMSDTGFSVPEAEWPRLAALYTVDPSSDANVLHPNGDLARRTPSFLSGGGGLVSSAYDYHRFTQMLLREGELDGVRLLSNRTVRYMTRNHLPGSLDLEEIGQQSFPGRNYGGIGFGLGFAVVVDPVRNKVLSSKGEFSWGGAASTAFWVDPLEQVTALFFTQLVSSSTTPIRSQLRQLVCQSIVD